jgi:potassium efflux system protein
LIDNTYAKPRVAGWHARLFAVLLLLGMGLTAAAQDTTSKPAESQPQAEPPPTTTQPATTQPAPTPPTETTTVVVAEEAEASTTVPTRESVQDRLAQIQAAADLTDTVKTELLGLYRQVLDQVTVAENRDAKIKELETGRVRAPDLLKEVKARVEALTTRPTSAPALDVAPEDTVETLNQKLAAREADLRTLQDAAKKLDDEAENRAARRSAIPDLLADASKRLERITKDLAAPAPTGTLPQVALARRTLLLAQKRAVELESREYEEEQRFYEARGALLNARREEARLAVVAAQATVSAWQELVNQRRQTEIERQQQQLATEELRRAPTAVRELLASNKALADEWATVDQHIKEVQDKYKEVTEKRTKLEKEFTDLRQKDREDPEGLAAVVGPEMRRKRDELLLLRSYERELRGYTKESARTERRVWEIDEETLELTDVSARAEEMISSVIADVPERFQERLKQRVQELYTTRRDTLKQIQPDYHAYAEDLRELRAAMTQTLAKADEFRDFIDQHILWLRSMEPLTSIRLPDNFLKRDAQWSTIGRALLHDLLVRAAIYAVAAMVFAGLLLARKRIRATLRELGQRVARPLTDRYRWTLQAGVHTVLFTLPWPALLVFAGWRLGSAVDVTDEASYELAQALTNGLYMAGLVLWTLNLARQVCRAKGLGEAHFRWDSGAVRLARQCIDWATPLIVLVVFVVYATERHADAAWRASFGRIAFIVGMIVLLVFLQRLLRPSTGILAPRMRKHETGGLYTLRYVWYPLVLLAPLVLAGASAAGYHYTAVRFAEDLVRTCWLLLGIVLLHAMLVRWLFVAQRRLAIERARKRRAVAAEAARAANQPPVSEAIELDEEKLNLVSIGDQTKRLLRSAAAVALFVGLWLIWADLLPALGFMQQIELWPYTVAAADGTAPAAGGTGEETAVGLSGGPRVEYITLAHLAIAIVVAVVTYILAKNIPGLLEIAILQKLPLDTGGRYAITALARYTIVVVGTVIAFGAIGIGWSKVQWLVAAMTVGLAFGLQEIFANFVSGLMLLFERPIRIGDTVTIGDVNGTVTRIRIRATTITDWDRKELIIPNKEFVTGQVINWTLSDPTLRITLPVGIAYGSNVELAEQTLLRLAREHSSVLESPEPHVIFTGFGDSTLDLELRVYISGIEHLLATRHEMNKAIDAAFRKANIEIAFPQRDLHIRTIGDALAVTRAARRPDSPPGQ